MKALRFFKSVAAYCRQACTKSDRDPTVTGYTKLSRCRDQHTAKWGNYCFDEAKETRGVILEAI
jgi:hypothetical protein